MTPGPGIEPATARSEVGRPTAAPPRRVIITVSHCYSIAGTSPASVCLSVCASCVCHRCCGHSFEQNLVKHCTVVWGRKTKIEFVSGQNPIMDTLPPIFTKPNAFSMGWSKHCSRPTAADNLNIRLL